MDLADVLYAQTIFFLREANVTGLLKVFTRLLPITILLLRRTKVTMFIVLFITHLIGQVLSTLTRNV